MKVNSRFAAFIMTYERPLILVDTIKAIKNQTISPAKILVIDNSQSSETERVVATLAAEDIEYLRMGYNAGPAGSAKLALEKLTNEGFDWIYWGDDDDPPVFPDCFEKLLSITNHSDSARTGIVGMVGHHLNHVTGNIDRVSDSVLHSTEWLSVDSIAGNQCMLVNAQAVRSGALPDADLFFGFEELDFCLRVKKAGFEIKVLTELFSMARAKYGKMNYRQPVYQIKKAHELKRQYYSIRNMLVILWRNRLYLATGYQSVKAIAKALYGFRFGFHYGSRNFFMLFTGMRDAWSNRLGRKH